jgi:hypothetical protein
MNWKNRFAQKFLPRQMAMLEKNLAKQTVGED